MHIRRLLAGPARIATVATLVAATLVGVGATAASAGSPPVITALSRHAGSIDGGDLLTIDGSGLGGVTAVSFGSAFVHTVHYVSGGVIQVRTPEQAAVLINVRAHSAYGTSARSVNTHFTFGTPPSVLDVQSSSGPTSGRTHVEIYGDSLDDPTSVTFGGVTATVIDSGDGAVEATTPAHAAGLVDVQVTTQYGTSAATADDTFRYAGSSTVAWAPSRQLDPDAGHPQSISCSTSLCAFVDAHGGLFMRHGTGSWQPAVASGTSQIAWSLVDCSTNTFCVAFASGAGEETHFNGTSWSAPAAVTGADSVHAVSCTGSTYCRAVSGSDILGWNGSRWTVMTTTSTLVDPIAVTCTQNVECDAVDRSGSVATYFEGAWTRGATLSKGEVPVAGGCSVTTCVVSFPSGATFTHDARTANSTWTATAKAPLAVYSIGCSADGSCTAIDGRGHIATLRGSAWSSVGKAGRNGVPAQLGCRSATSCDVVDIGGYATTVADGTGAAPTTVDPTRGGGLAAVSCAAGLCALLDSTGNAFTRSGTGAWVGPVKLADEGVAVSCATSSWCLATSPTDAFVLHGSTWHSVGSAGRDLVAVSCAAADYCIGASGQSLYRFDGSTWTGVFTFAHTVDDVSCSSVGHCVAASDGNVQARLTGTKWTKLPTAPTGVAIPSSVHIACPTDTVCLLSGSAGSVAELNGSSWTLTQHVLDGLSDLACASATRCIAVDNDINQYYVSTATFDGTSWSAPSDITDQNFVGFADTGVLVAASSPTTWLAATFGFVIGSR